MLEIVMLAYDLCTQRTRSMDVGLRPSLVYSGRPGLLSQMFHPKQSTEKNVFSAGEKNLGKA